MPDSPSTQSDGAFGYQWLLDPSGHRWRIVGFNVLLAHLEDADGRQLNVGKSLLRSGLESGAWQEAEFEEVDGA